MNLETKQHDCIHKRYSRFLTYDELMLDNEDALIHEWHHIGYQQQQNHQSDSSIFNHFANIDDKKEESVIYRRSEALSSVYNMLRNMRLQNLISTDDDNAGDTFLTNDNDHHRHQYYQTWKLKTTHGDHTMMAYDEKENDEKQNNQSVLLLHRRQGPSVLLCTGYQEWYLYGLLDRADEYNAVYGWYESLPSIIHPNGTLEYFRSGVRHRSHNKPAIVMSDGTLVFIREGKLHRDKDLPALVLSTGHYEWYVNGLRHRDSYYSNIKDIHNVNMHQIISSHHQSSISSSSIASDGVYYLPLPAVIYPDGSCEWYVHGNHLASGRLAQSSLPPRPKPLIK